MPKSHTSSHDKLLNVLRNALRSAGGFSAAIRAHENSPAVIDHSPMRIRATSLSAASTLSPRSPKLPLEKLWAQIMARVPLPGLLLLEMRAGIDKPAFRAETEARPGTPGLPLDRGDSGSPDAVAFALFNPDRIIASILPLHGHNHTSGKPWGGVPFVTAGGSHFVPAWG